MSMIREITRDMLFSGTDNTTNFVVNVCVKAIDYRNKDVRPSIFVIVRTMAMDGTCLSKGFKSKGKSLAASVNRLFKQIYNYIYNELTISLDVRDMSTLVNTFKYLKTLNS